jgi:hypothetical protein
MLSPRAGGRPNGVIEGGQAVTIQDICSAAKSMKPRNQLTPCEDRHSTRKKKYESNESLARQRGPCMSNVGIENGGQSSKAKTQGKANESLLTATELDFKDDSYTLFSKSSNSMHRVASSQVTAKPPHKDASKDIHKGRTEGYGSQSVLSSESLGSVKDRPIDTSPCLTGASLNLQQKVDNEPLSKLSNRASHHQSSNENKADSFSGNRRVRDIRLHRAPLYELSNKFLQSSHPQSPKKHKTTSFRESGRSNEYQTNRTNSWNGKRLNTFVMAQSISNSKSVEKALTIPTNAVKSVVNSDDFGKTKKSISDSGSKRKSIPPMIVVPAKRAKSYGGKRRNTINFSDDAFAFL